MNWIEGIFGDIKKDMGIAQPKLQAFGASVEKLLPVGIQVVQEINALAPNKTLAELNTIAVKYALPTVTALADGQTAGNVALNLGTQILEKNHAPGAATSLLNTVIQVAAGAVGAGAIPATSPAA